MDLFDVIKGYVEELKRKGLTEEEALNVLTMSLNSNIVKNEIEMQNEIIIQNEGLEKQNRKDLKHKIITFADFKKMFSVKVTKKEIQENINEDKPFIVDGKKIFFYKNGKGIFAEFKTKNFHYHVRG